VLRLINILVVSMVSWICPCKNAVFSILGGISSLKRITAMTSLHTSLLTKSSAMRSTRLHCICSQRVPTPNIQAVVCLKLKVRVAAF